MYEKTLIDYNGEHWHELLEKWARSHTCADCDQCVIAPDEFGNLGFCRFDDDYTDTTNNCYDYCNGNYFPRDAREVYARA